MSVRRPLEEEETLQLPTSISYVTEYLESRLAACHSSSQTCLRHHTPDNL